MGSSLYLGVKTGQTEIVKMQIGEMIVSDGQDAHRPSVSDGRDAHRPSVSDGRDACW